RPDLREAAFPEAQHMLGHVEFVGDLADGAKCIRRLVHERAPSTNGSRPKAGPQSHARTLKRRVRGYSASSATAMPLMRCLRIADGLNTMTRRGEIGTSLPVFGLRPMRCPFLRTTNEPNDDNFTVWPRSKQSVISCNTSSTSEADSLRDRPTLW